MIRRFFCCLLALCCLWGGQAGAMDMQDALVRLQVRARSDSPADQALKLALRDTCLRCAEVCIGDAVDADEAYDRLQIHLDDFYRACAARAAELGYHGKITVEAGRFAFPDRIYGNVPVSAGEYRALRVTIGGGEGHNWWCVLYPRLCALDEMDYAGGERVYYSGILRWLGDKIGGLR